MSRSFFVRISPIVAIVAVLAGCTGTRDDAQAPPIEAPAPPTPPSETAQPSPTPSTAPPVVNNLPQWEDYEDAQTFVEQTLTLLAETVRQHYPDIPSEYEVRIIRGDQQLECADPDVFIDGDNLSSDVVWCNSAGRFYVPVAALRGEAAFSSLRATIFVMQGYGAYLLIEDDYADRPGFRDCMVGYMTPLLVQDRTIDSSVARQVTEHFDGSTWYGGGNTNGRERCQGN